MGSATHVVGNETRKRRRKPTPSIRFLIDVLYTAVALPSAAPCRTAIYFDKKIIFI
jgi:hypothetical protein